MRSLEGLIALCEKGWRKRLCCLIREGNMAGVADEECPRRVPMDLDRDQRKGVLDFVKGALNLEE